MGHGRDLKNPIECVPKRENTFFVLKILLIFLNVLKPDGI